MAEPRGSAHLEPVRPEAEARIRVVVIGAGAGGLAMAARLRIAGIDDFVVLERSDGVGGTWRDNSYPDAACDVPSHFYSFSFAQNPDWSRKWAKQPEILEYFESLLERFDMADHFRFGVEVTEVAWSDEDLCWTIRSSDGSHVVADVVVSGLGQLNMPHIPDFEGLGNFEGTKFHSARWDHDHDLAGRSVGVIGIGASAIQFVPPIAADARRVTLFQRSANYVVPKPDRGFKAWERWLFRNVAPLQHAYRVWTYWRLESRFNLMRRGSWMGRLLQKRFASELAKMASQRLPVEVLVPDYMPGCRRLLLSSDWYPTLLRDNVEVVGAGVDRVTPDGLDTTDGRHFELDTIVFGTGFTTTQFLTPLRVTGSGGRDLNEVWTDGAVAYMGLSVSGFPNLFILYGPNTNLGHNSILFMIEQQVHYVLAALEQLDRRGAAAMDVIPDALARWDAEMQQRSEDTVWAGNCSSWYKTASGRVTNNWVGHTTEYRRRMHAPIWDDWWFVRPR